MANLVWCECCEKGAWEDECDFKQIEGDRKDLFEITHKIEGCGLVFVVSQVRFYEERRNERIRRDKPMLRNPFIPINII